MNCKKARELMSAAVDSELTSKEELGFQQHLDDCPECRSEFEEARKTKLIVKEKIVRFKAPQSLVNSIMQLSALSAGQKADSILND